MVERNIDINIPVIPNPSGEFISTYVTPVASGIDIGIPVPTISTPTVTIGAVAYIQTYTHNIPGPSIELVTTYYGYEAVVETYSHDIPIPSIAGVFINASGGVVTPSGTQHIPISSIELSYTTRVVIELDAAHTFVYPSTYVDETAQCQSDTTNDIHLLPSGCVVGDGFLIGIEHPSWDGLVFNIGTAGVGNWTLEWTYWNGTTWAGLTVLSDETNSFKTAGVLRVSFTQPTLWSLTTFNGKEAYYLRVRVISGSTFTTLPLGTRLRAYQIVGRQLNSRQMMNEDIGTYRMTHLHIRDNNYRMRLPIPWSFKLVDYRDYASQRSLLTPHVYVSQDGHPFQLISEPITAIGNGWYYVTIPAAYTNCKKLGLRVIAAGAAQADMVLDIIGKML